MHSRTEFDGLILRSCPFRHISTILEQNHGHFCGVMLRFEVGGHHRRTPARSDLLCPYELLKVDSNDQSGNRSVDSAAQPPRSPHSSPSPGRSPIQPESDPIRSYPACGASKPHEACSRPKKQRLWLATNYRAEVRSTTRQ